MFAFLKRLFRNKSKRELPHCFDGGISQVDSNGKVLKRECLTTTLSHVNPWSMAMLEEKFYANKKAIEKELNHEED